VTKLAEINGLATFETDCHHSTADRFSSVIAHMLHKISFLIQKLTINQVTQL